MTALDTGTEDLLAEVDDGVAVITMNRPSRRNAFSNDMVEALGRVLAQVELSDEVGCVVLTGAGDAFSAGGDVTAIPGPPAAAGLSLALACDLRYAAETAIFTTAFARVAFAGDYGGTWFLTRLVGPAKAKELYYFSERFTADQAEKLGLVNAVFPAGELEKEVMDRARRLAAGPSIAYRYMKENLNRAVHGNLEECMDLEVTHHIHTGLTEDHWEAAQAFVEKRELRFRGR